MDRSTKEYRYWHNNLPQNTVEYVERLEGHSSKINAVLITPCNNFVITCGGSGNFEYKDNTVRVWDSHTKVQVIIFSGHMDRVTCLAMSEDGTRIFSGSFDFTIIEWDLLNKKLIHRYQEHDDFIVCLETIEDKMVSVSRKSILIIWDTIEKTKIHSLSISQKDYLLKVPNFDSICLKTLGRKFEKLSLRSSLNVSEKRLIITVGTIFQIAVDNTFMVSGDKNNVNIFDLVLDKVSCSLRGHLYSVKYVSLACNDQKIVSSSIFAVRVWDVQSRSQENFFDCTGLMIACNKSLEFFITSKGKSIQMHTVNDNVETEKEFECHHGVITSIFIDSEYIITSASDHYLKLWEKSTGQLVNQKVFDKNNFLQSISLTKNRKFLVTSTTKKLIVVWDFKKTILSEPEISNKLKNTSELFEPTESGKDNYEKLALMKL